MYVGIVGSEESVSETTSFELLGGENRREKRCTFIFLCIQRTKESLTGLPKSLGRGTATSSFFLNSGKN